MIKRSVLTIDIPIYECEVVIDTHNGSKGLKKALGEEKAEFVESSKIGRRGVCINFDNDWQYYLWVSEELDGSEFLSTLSHEVFHLVHYILRDKGVVFGEKSEESFAYLFGWVMRELCDRLNLFPSPPLK